MSWGDPKIEFLLLFLSVVRRPPFRLTKNKFPDFAPPSDLRRPNWGQSYTVGSILYSGANPMYWPQVGRWTSDRGNVRRSFLWSVSPSVGGESDGEGHCWTADDGRRTDGRKFLLLFKTVSCSDIKALKILTWLCFYQITHKIDSQWYYNFNKI